MMNMRRCHRMVRNPLAACLLAMVATVLSAGCGGGGGIGTDVKKPASERPDIDRAAATSGALVIPANQAFNLTSFKSGQTETARGAAEMVGNDGATCRAEARKTGSAWGEFQLGYCFDNVTDARLDATVKVRFTVKEAISAEEAGDESASAMPTATNALVFFIKDATNGPEIKKEELLSSDIEKGAGSTNTAHDLVFDGRFEPGHGYYLVIAGRTDVRAVPSQSVACSLDVTNCSMEIAWRGITSRDGEAAASSLPRQGASEPEAAP